ncbi:HNH endonuclease [Acidaminobacter sp. JC074]|uniref:RNA-guided endonuclease IscB n=1 Tax=Acidaminobacter sp. JC074 TaxID=2530199 RepID=UPI001F0F0B72|nr:RNA-guided endonuclease IscB [Acidaminobacter sp. JC074]MCH4890345.1 HNH endonuclease [Acidaminobacter sp. JC074]
MVFVLNKNKTPLNPCHPAKARWLLNKGYAVVHKREPFTIRLKQLIVDPETKDYILKFDPGAKTTGIAIVEDAKVEAKVVFLGELEHRAEVIKSNLDDRRSLRRSRRNRKTRYRKPRFLNRTRKEGWLPPSVQSNVDNIETMTDRLQKLCPIKAISLETVRFDTQLMDKPDISGIEYQQGTLFGNEVREYLLYTSNHTCQYCKGESQDVILEVEHMVSRNNGGTDRVSNLTIACRTCNQEKASRNLEDWFESLKGSYKKIDQIRIKHIENILSKGRPGFYRDAARVNTSRKSTYQMLSRKTEHLEVSSGGRTKFNRSKMDLEKTHYYDALCVGEIPESFDIPKDLKVQKISACGRGSHSRTLLDKYGFPRAYKPRQKYHHGYKSGDLVKANVPKGKKKGTYYGIVSCRTSGYFNIKTKHGTVQGINYKYCELVQKADGYNYSSFSPITSFPLTTECHEYPGGC